MKSYIAYTALLLASASAVAGQGGLSSPAAILEGPAIEQEANPPFARSPQDLLLAKTLAEDDGLTGFDPSRTGFPRETA